MRWLFAVLSRALLVFRDEVRGEHQPGQEGEHKHEGCEDKGDRSASFPGRRGMLPVFKADKARDHGLGPHDEIHSGTPSRMRIVVVSPGLRARFLPIGMPLDWLYGMATL